MEWIECNAEPDLLGEREGHCAALITSVRCGDSQQRDSYVVVIGGYSEGELSGYPLIASSETLPHSLEWCLLPHQTPLECDGATLTSISATTALLFGGLDESMDRRNTVYQVQLVRDAQSHTNTDECRTITAAAGVTLVAEELTTTGEAPAPRSRHGVGASGGKLYVFGGETDDAEQSNSLHVLDVATHVWRRVEFEKTASSLWPAPRLQCLPLVFVPDAGTARPMSDASASRFVLYGGCHFVNGVVQSLNDVWMFDTRGTGRWISLKPAEKDSDRQPFPSDLLQGHGDVVSELPCCNGHGGGILMLEERPFLANGVCVCCFIGGKDVSEGCDDVKVVAVPPADALDAIQDCVPCTFFLEKAVGRETVPHWRYTPAVVTVPGKGLLMIAGNCRHPQSPSVLMLRRMDQ